MTRLTPLALVVAASLAFAPACGDDDEPRAATTSAEATTTSARASGDDTTTTSEAVSGTTIELTVSGGEVEGGVQTHDVAVGDEVTLRVTADVDDEVHVHGYDLVAEVTSGATAELRFTADIPGVFEVELEHSRVPIAELRVS